MIQSANRHIGTIDHAAQFRICISGHTRRLRDYTIPYVKEAVCGPPSVASRCRGSCCRACSISSVLSRPPARPIAPPPSTMKACAFVAALAACATKSLAFVAPLQSSTLTFSSPRSSLAAAATATTAVSDDDARREARNGSASLFTQDGTIVRIWWQLYPR